MDYKSKTKMYDRAGSEYSQGVNKYGINSYERMQADLDKIIVNESRELTFPSSKSPMMNASGSQKRG